jgi:hypothetical protein
MCCLRYEHEFYVQSRKRFPKEGRILVTLIGEEKVLANDIFNDRVTLRGPEGDTRVVALADLRRELDRVADGGAAPAEIDDESDGVDASEAHEGLEAIDEIVATVVADLPIVPVPTLMIARDPAPARARPASEPEAAPPQDAGSEAATAGTEEQRARRRRGRRGGRRGKRPGERGPTSADE